MKSARLPNFKKNQRFLAKSIFYLSCLFILIFTSCVRYQFISIGSNLKETANKEYLMEDDTVSLKYSFSGEDFPITLTVFNKLQQPLYFDWKSSVVIMNDNQINDAFNCENQVASIAPQSSTTVKTNNLSDKFIPLSPQDKITDSGFATSNGITSVKVHVFNEENSPVYFRSVLALSTQKDLSSPLFYDHPFWVSGIYQTMDSSPSNVPSNQFHMKKATGFGTFMGYTFAIVLLVAIAAISPQGE